MARFNLDPKAPPELSEADRARLEGLTDAQITDAALSDPDNPPLDEVELRRLDSARAVREARTATGLSQAAFAHAYRINVARLRDLEQGRTQADSALLAYLTVIRREREAVERALG